MDVKSLYTLIAIADRGSFAEAGQVIGLSLSAVSSQMKLLEDELGIQIFDRKRRPPVLTENGLALTARARDLIAHWESMSAALKRDASAGLLKVGAVHDTLVGVLPLALKYLQQQDQAIDIHLTTGLTYELEKTLYHRQIDAAVVTEPESIRSEFDFFPFSNEPFVVITYQDTSGKTDKQLLESTPYVRFNRTARLGHMIHDEITRRKINVRTVMEIDTLDGVIAMVAHGLGSAVVPSGGMRADFPFPIQTVPFGKPPLTRRVGLLVPRDNPRAHLAQQLLGALRAVSVSNTSPGTTV